MEKLTDLMLRFLTFSCGLFVACLGMMVLSFEPEIQHMIPAIASMCLGLYMCIIALGR